MGGDHRDKDKRDKRDRDEDRDKRDKRDRDDDRDKREKRDKDDDRKRDRSRDKEHKDKDRTKSHRAEEKDKERKEKEKRSDKDRERDREHEKGKDKTEKKDKEKKEKVSKQFDSLFGEKFVANQPQIVPPPHAFAPNLMFENNEPAPEHVFNQNDDVFDATLGVPYAMKPVSISIAGKRVGLPRDATRFFKIDQNDLDQVNNLEAPPLNPMSGALTVAGVGGGALGALADMSSQMISTEQVRMARENRRMYITGFPRLTPKEIIQSVIEARFPIYRREIVARMSEKDVSEIPEDAEVTIDRIVEIFLENQKEKPFAFIEINTDDMVEMFINPTNNYERPVNIALTDGTNAPLNFGHPRDFKKLTASDPSRVLIQGIHPKFDADKMKQLVAKIAGGTPTEFAMKDGIAFAEFEDEEHSARLMEGLNSVVLMKRLMCAQPLTEVMRALCINNLGFKIPFKALPEIEEPKAKEDDSVFMELLKISTLLPQTMTRLHTYHPHLAPLMGATLPVHPTRILVLLNIVDDSDLDTDASYATLCENVAAEVETYGRVESLIIPRHEPPPPPMFIRKQIERPPSVIGTLPLNNPFDPMGTASHGMVLPKTPEEILYETAMKEEDEKEAKYEQAKREYPRKREEWERSKDHPVHGNTGKIYVVYATKHEAQKAQQGLCGKLYCNRTVVTSFLFEDILYPPQPTPQPEVFSEAAGETNAAVHSEIDEQRIAVTEENAGGNAADLD